MNDLERLEQLIEGRRCIVYFVTIPKTATHPQPFH